MAWITQKILSGFFNMPADRQTLQTGSSHFAPLPRGSKKNGAKVVGATSSVEFSSC